MKCLQQCKRKEREGANLVTGGTKLLYGENRQHKVLIIHEGVCSSTADVRYSMG